MSAWILVVRAVELVEVFLSSSYIPHTTQRQKRRNRTRGKKQLQWQVAYALPPSMPLHHSVTDDPFWKQEHHNTNFRNGSSFSLPPFTHTKTCTLPESNPLHQSWPQLCTSYSTVEPWCPVVPKLTDLTGRRTRDAWPRFGSSFGLCFRILDGVRT